MQNQIISVTKIIDPEDLQSESGDGGEFSDPENAPEPSFNEPEEFGNSEE